MTDIDTSQMPEEVRQHIEFLRRLREAYHLPPGNGEPMTMEEMKRGEMLNALDAAERAILDHNCQQDMEPNDYFKYWLHRPTNDRDLPGYAMLTAIAGCYTPDGLRDIVADAWSLPEFPEANYSADHWSVLFTLSGHIHSTPDGIAPLKIRSIPVLYRGAIHSRRKGLAWTSDRERAEWFANRFNDVPTFGTGHVWVLDGIPHGRVLGRFDNRGEDEWVINTKGMTPRKVES
jgi:hypothetical protein